MFVTQVRSSLSEGRLHWLLIMPMTVHEHASGCLQATDRVIDMDADLPGILLQCRGVLVGVPEHQPGLRPIAHRQRVDDRL